jgi:hypothetical protein
MKVADHGVDALRYAIFTTRALWQRQARPRRLEGDPLCRCPRRQHAVAAHPVGDPARRHGHVAGLVLRRPQPSGVRVRRGRRLHPQPGGPRVLRRRPAAHRDGRAAHVLGAGSFARPAGREAARSDRRRHRGDVGEPAVVGGPAGDRRRRLHRPATAKTTQAQIGRYLDDRGHAKLREASELTAGLSNVYLRVVWDTDAAPAAVAGRDAAGGRGADVAVGCAR